MNSPMLGALAELPLPLILGAPKLVSALTGKGSAAKAAGRAAKGAGKKAAGTARRKRNELRVEIKEDDGADGSSERTE